jgi:hypothetical protein
MNPKRLIVACILLAAFSSSIASSQQRATLNAEQQEKFLADRLPSRAITGTFSAFGSFLHAALNITIHTNDNEIGETELHSPFPEFYKPTVKELLNTIALQTKSSWSYDSQTGYWTFAKPAASKPFSLKLADKWTSDDRGIYVSHRPPGYPVGMDIYYYGSYSAEDPAQQTTTWERVRNSWATGFASRLKRDVKISEMERRSVDGVEALYFESPTPRPGVMWRQWALVKNGHAFVIVSTLSNDDKTSLADVESMIKSFRVS